MKNPRLTVKVGIVPLLAACLALLLHAGAAWARDWSPEYEAKVGRQALEEVKKEYKLWDNPAQAKRCLDIVNNLKVVSQRPDVQYQIFLLDTKEENAFSLPGGYICVTKALLDSVQSDDELAGVIGHEMAHNCTFDALNEAQQQQELTLPMLAAVIATMAMGRGAGAAGSVMTAGMVVTQGIMSTYSVKIESRADMNGLSYVMKSGKYNPVGMLTFMERLASPERAGPQTPLGIYQDHPLSIDRVSAIADQLAAAGIPINRRAVTKWDPPKLASGKLGDQPVQILSLWGQDLLDFNWAPAGAEVAQRGQTMLKTLTDLLAAGVDGWEFSSVPVDDGVAFRARGQEVFHLYPEDAKLRGLTMADLTAEVQRNLNSAFFRERLQRGY